MFYIVIKTNVYGSRAKSCEKIGAQVSQKLIVVHGIILLSLTAANTYDPQTLQMVSEAIDIGIVTDFTI